MSLIFESIKPVAEKLTIGNLEDSTLKRSEDSFCEDVGRPVRWEDFANDDEVALKEDRKSLKLKGNAALLTFDLAMSSSGPRCCKYLSRKKLYYAL